MKILCLSLFLGIIGMVDGAIQESINFGEIQEQLDKMSEVTPENYLKEIQNFRSYYSQYIQFRQKLCQGEMSTYNINGQTYKTTQKKNIPKAEKKNCLFELSNFKKLYLTKFYQARKNFLQYSHEKRLKDLEVAHKRAITNLEDI